MSASYKALKDARPAVWAQFRLHAEYPGDSDKVYMCRVIKWALKDDGSVVALVLNSKTGQLSEAQEFNNFIRFDYGRGGERMVSV